MKFFKDIRQFVAILILAMPVNYALAQCITPVITSISNSGPICAGGTLKLSAAGTVGGTSSSFIRVAGIGGNQGNREFDDLFSSGDRPGRISRINEAQFNSLASGGASALRANYDVLLFTWATSTSLNVNWPLIDSYLSLGGSVFWEDEQNVHKLSPVIAGQHFEGSLGCGYSIVNPAPFPALVGNGVNGCFANHHLRVLSWPSWMQPYITGAGSTFAVAGIHPTAGGRMIVQGPDQDFHAVRGGSDPGGNQYKFILNQIDFLTAEQTGISWTGPNGFTSNEANPTITNITAAAAGVYTATLTNKTGGGCSVTATTTVVVKTPPVLICPANISQPSDPGKCSAKVSFAALGSDNITYSHQPGNDFPIGITTVTVTGTNECGSSSCSFTVTVTDEEKPIITGVPSNILVGNDLGVCQAQVSWQAPVFTDNCSAVTVTSDHNPGETFPVGITLVTYTGTDATGNSISSSFNVTVRDISRPTFFGKPLIIAEDSDPGVCGKKIKFSTPPYADNCGVVSITSSHQSGDFFPVGTTSVSFIARDAAGNIAVTGITIMVYDKESPVVVGMPADMELSNDAGLCGANVSWRDPVAIDNCVGATLTSDVSPGSFFPLGSTLVTYTATDANGNKSVYNFTVTIKDAEKPVITGLPSIVHANTDAGLCGARIIWSAPSVSDNCSSVTATSNRQPGDVFPVGTTEVVYSAVDDNGNTVTSSFNVIVTDTEKPRVSCSTDLLFCFSNSGEYLIPKMVASDNCGIKSVSYSIHGSTNRSDVGNDASGRFNTGTSMITWTITDVNGNSSTCESKVTINTPVVVTIPDTYAVNPGGQPNTIYIGYGPSSLTLTALQTGGMPGYSYSWSNGSSGQSTVVNPGMAGIYIYKVTVTDSKGCIGVASISIKVVDVRCGNKNDKVLVCQVPAGNPGNEHTICISPNAVNTHLLNGSKLGSCMNDITSSNRNRIIDLNAVENSVQIFEVVVSPNPTQHRFTLNLQTSSSAPATIRITDQLGRLIQVLPNVNKNANTYLGMNLRPGVYFAEVLQGKHRKVIKLIKN